MTLTVELLGLPGSGKSTLAGTAAGQLRRHGVEVVTESRAPGGPGRKLIFYGSFVLRHPLFALRSLRAILASEQISLRDFRRGLVVWLKRSARTRAHPARGEVRLVDAGAFQGLWSIAYSSRSEVPLQRFHRLQEQISLPDMVFVVETEPLVAARRLHRRSGRTSRLEGDLEAGGDAMKRAQAALGATCEVLELSRRRRPDLEVVRLPNDRDTDRERNASIMVERIRSALASR